MADGAVTYPQVNLGLVVVSWVILATSPSFLITVRVVQSWSAKSSSSQAASSGRVMVRIVLSGPSVPVTSIRSKFSVPAYPEDIDLLR